jgi:hypothetical protein
MTSKPGRIIAAWAAGNVVLAALMFIYHEKIQFILMYFLATLPLLFGGLLLWAADRRHRVPPQELRTGQRSGLTLPLALGVGLAGLGTVYGLPFILVGLLLALISLLILLSRPVTRPAAPDEYVAPHPVSAPVPRREVADTGPTRLLGRLVVAGLTVAGWRRRSQRGQR